MEANLKYEQKAIFFELPENEKIIILRSFDPRFGKRHSTWKTVRQGWDSTSSTIALLSSIIFIKKIYSWGVR